MKRVTFERPTPLRPGLLTDASTEYVRTPYPPYALLLPSPSSLSASTVNERSIYYLSQGDAPPELSVEIYDFFRTWSPPENLDIRSSSSLLAVDSQCGLHLPHPLVYESGPTRLVHAYHIYVRFRYGGPGPDQWEDIVKDFRNCVLSRYDELVDAAIELALSRENGSISAWYPPKIDKDKLMAYFEGTDCDDSDSAAEDGEDRSGPLEVPTTSNGTMLPELRVDAPEGMLGLRNF
ncbi:hypothetical protein F5B17DRAFT_392505 [Nemania serpens]|nr:hypothetical protein F5B17DRAFT_392505 [Nemania serpens]